MLENSYILNLFAAYFTRWEMKFTAGEIKIVSSELLTLVDVKEGLAELAGEDGFRQVSEVLLHHVSNVKSRLTIVWDGVRVGLHKLTEVLDTRLHPRLPKKTNLRESTTTTVKIKERNCWNSDIYFLFFLVDRFCHFRHRLLRPSVSLPGPDIRSSSIPGLWGCLEEVVLLFAEHWEAEEPQTPADLSPLSSWSSSAA